MNYSSPVLKFYVGTGHQNWYKFLRVINACYQSLHFVKSRMVFNNHHQIQTLKLKIWWFLPSDTIGIRKSNNLYFLIMSWGNDESYCAGMIPYFSWASMAMYHPSSPCVRLPSSDCHALFIQAGNAVLQRLTLLSLNTLNKRLLAECLVGIGRCFRINQSWPNTMLKAF